MHITFTLLGLAIIGVWLPSMRLGHRVRIAPWAVLFGAAVLTGLRHGVLTWLALIPLFAMAGLCLRAQSRVGQTSHGAWTLATCTLSLALALHALPGFHNPKLLDAVRTSAQAAPFTLYANFDKASAGLFLLVFFAPRLRSWRECVTIAGPTLLCSAIAATITLGIAWATGHIQPDVKLPAFTALFLAVNLLFTCVAEEAFFRGLIQTHLTKLAASRPALAWVPIAVSAGLFGLAHAGGGFGYVALAGLAGFAYALVYARTFRIEAAVLTHLLLNGAHFLLFTYPSRAL